MWDADGSHLSHIVVRVHDRLDFRRTDPLTRDVHRVIASAKDIPETVFIDGGKVSVYPDIFDPRPVGFEIAFPVLPESPGHPDPRLSDDEFPDLSTNGSSC